jgi:hypothetical protein
VIKPLFTVMREVEKKLVKLGEGADISVIAVASPAAPTASV